MGYRTVKLYHGTNWSPSKIKKAKGIYPPPSGEEVHGERQVFTTPIESVAENYGKYIYEIEYEFRNDFADRIDDMLRRVDAGIELDDDDSDIIEILFDHVDLDDIKCVRSRSRRDRECKQLR